MHVCKNGGSFEESIGAVTGGKTHQQELCKPLPDPRQFLRIGWHLKKVIDTVNDGFGQHNLGQEHPFNSVQGGIRKGYPALCFQICCTRRQKLQQKIIHRLQKLPCPDFDINERKALGLRECKPFPALVDLDLSLSSGNQLG